MAERNSSETGPRNIDYRQLKANQFFIDQLTSLPELQITITQGGIIRCESAGSLVRRFWVKRLADFGASDSVELVKLTPRNRGFFAYHPYNQRDLEKEIKISEIRLVLSDVRTTLDSEGFPETQLEPGLKPNPAKYLHLDPKWLIYASRLADTYQLAQVIRFADKAGNDGVYKPDGAINLPGRGFVPRDFMELA